MASILLIGKGGFGDMLPLWGLAGELKRRGHTVHAAGERHHRSTAQALDIDLSPLADSGAPLAAASDAEIASLLPLAHRADLLIGNPLAPVVPILAHLSDTPWVYATASPLAIPSRSDPPFWPILHPIQSLAPDAAWLQRSAFRLARISTRLAMRDQQRHRHRHGLRDHHNPRFEGFYSPHLNLILSSPQLTPAQPDWPAHTHVTGFCTYLPPFLNDPQRRKKLNQFLDQGPPPILIAPGGRDRANPRHFVDAALDACQRLGHRAIVVLGSFQHDRVPDHPRFLQLGYLPYPILMSASRAVIHSGGIGALGWALRAGKPSLLLPSAWDQFDNTRRAVARGLALSLPTHSNGKVIARALATLLTDNSSNLTPLAEPIRKEKGESSAANAIEQYCMRELHL